MAQTQSIVQTGRGARLERMRTVASLMDVQFNFLGIRYGFDSLIGLFPLLGDFVTACISLYILWEAYMLGVPEKVLSKMFQNVIIDAFIGGIPLIGDLFDLVFKANKRNLALVEEYLNA